MAGAIAQMIDYQSSLATKQAAVGAMLHASAHYKVSSSNYGIAGSTQISEKEGAGKLDARSARGIAYYGNFWSLTIDKDDFTYELTDHISSSNSQTRVAISVMKEAVDGADEAMRGMI